MPATDLTMFDKQLRAPGVPSWFARVANKRRTGVSPAADRVSPVGLAGSATARHDLGLPPKVDNRDGLRLPQMELALALRG